MGTRSLSYVYSSYQDDEGKKVNEPIVCMYRQYDGYVEGHGAELAAFLNGGRLVNGLLVDGLGVKTDEVWNGMGCLAASLVAHFKKDAGNFYLHAPRLGRDDWQEYEYHVFDDKVIVYAVRDPKDIVLFEGSYKAFWLFTANALAEDPGVPIDPQDSTNVKDALKTGEVFINFIKKDGSNRVMRCTTKPALVPEEFTPKGTKAASDEVQSVFDLDENHWKSFRWDSLVSAKAI